MFINIIGQIEIRLNDRLSAAQEVTVLEYWIITYTLTVIGLQPIKTRAEWDSSITVIFETNILRVSLVKLTGDTRKIFVSDIIQDRRRVYLGARLDRL